MGFWTELNKLEDLQGSNDKELHIGWVIEVYPEAEEFFRLAFNDTVYGLAEKSFYNAFGEEPNTEYGHVSDWLYTMGNYKNIMPIVSFEKLKVFIETLKRESGQNQLDRLRLFFTTLPKLQRKWFSRLLLHDLRCGVQVKTFNHVLKDMGKKPVEKFALMLAGKIKNPYDKEEVMKKLEFPSVRETKYDGIRVQAEIFQDEQGHDFCILTSRRGKSKTDDYPGITQELLRIFEGQDVILDGEVISSSFQELTRKESIATKKYVVFDILNQESLAYKFRWSNLNMLFGSFDSDIVILPEHDEINTYEDFIEDFEKSVKAGEEGIMVKFLEDVYERNTRKHMFKVKKVYTADLEIVGFNYGEGKRAGKVGSLKLRTRDGLITVDVGSGITDDICDVLTAQVGLMKMEGYDKNRELGNPDFIGQICEIAYNEVTETGSIRFPRFITIREDKENADSSEEINTR